MSFTKKLIGIAVLFSSFSLTSFADNNPIKNKKNIRKNYKTTTVASSRIQTDADQGIKPKKRKGAYHIQNKAGLNSLAGTEKVEGGKQLSRGTNGVYPFMKWTK